MLGLNVDGGTMEARGRLTSRGRVTIPREVRDALDLQAGDLVRFDVVDGGARITRTPDLMRLAGSVTVPDGVRGRSWDEVRRRARAAR